MATASPPLEESLIVPLKRENKFPCVRVDACLL